MPSGQKKLLVDEFLVGLKLVLADKADKWDQALGDDGMAIQGGAFQLDYNYRNKMEAIARRADKLRRDRTEALRYEILRLDKERIKEMGLTQVFFKDGKGVGNTALAAILYAAGVTAEPYVRVTMDKDALVVSAEPDPGGKRIG